MTDDSAYALENIRVKCLQLDLWDLIECIDKEDRDRIYFTAARDLRYRLAGDSRFQRTPIGEEHRKWLRGVFAVPESANFWSYREANRPSLQVTLFDDKVLCRGEMDIDLSSPLMDVWGFIIHVVEVLIPGPTNHKKLRAKLMKDPETRKYFA